VRLGRTFGAAGRLEGDLTPRCAAAAAAEAVLGALGRRFGPEDTRTAGQRWHDVRHRTEGWAIRDAAAPMLWQATRLRAGRRQTEGTKECGAQLGPRVDI
jgi:hypothetical protein